MGASAALVLCHVFLHVGSAELGEFKWERLIQEQGTGKNTGKLAGKVDDLLCESVLLNRSVQYTTCLQKNQFFPPAKSGIH